MAKIEWEWASDFKIEFAFSSFSGKCISLPRKISQSLKVVSQEPEARNFSSGEKERVLTASSCYIMCFSSREKWSLGFQSMTVLSLEQEAKYLHFGENATDITAFECPDKVYKGWMKFPLVSQIMILPFGLAAARYFPQGENERELIE